MVCCHTESKTLGYLCSLKADIFVQGGFWLSFASTLTPAIGAYGHYSTMYSEADPSAGLNSPQFAASFAFWLLAMALLSLIFAVCCLRTNVCLLIVESTLVVVFSLLAATFWQLAEGNAAVGSKCLVVGFSLLLPCLSRSVDGIDRSRWLDFNTLTSPILYY